MQKSLSELNACGKDEFVASLANIFEYSPWIAGQAASMRPFPGVNALFAAMTALFVVIAAAVVVLGFVAPHSTGMAPSIPYPGSHPTLFAVLLAFPVAMALATGVEAPSTPIAQLASSTSA